AKALGHDVAVFGRPNPDIPLNYLLGIDAADAVVFIFEWTTQLLDGDALDVVRLVSKIPRRRRGILHGGRKYKYTIPRHVDYNHRAAAEAQQWMAVCDSLSDKICQPPLHPLRRNVQPFLFYSYSPAWERPLPDDPKPFSMIYIGHSKFRWHPMQSILHAIE